MEGLEARFAKELELKADSEENFALQAEKAGASLAKFAEFLAKNNMPIAAADARLRAGEHAANAEEHLAELERTMSLLNDPLRFKRIIEIARRELGRAIIQRTVT